mmetsp:Transcript_12395/g.20987  ORF Transcript_12395/g.20987 Transcript_12395/m.20987 type:complete len:397 (+) Transcript_12395:346-1536(+)
MAVAASSEAVLFSLFNSGINLASLSAFSALDFSRPGISFESSFSRSLHSFIATAAFFASASQLGPSGSGFFFAFAISSISFLAFTSATSKPSISSSVRPFLSTAAASCSVASSIICRSVFSLARLVSAIVSAAAAAACFLSAIACFTACRFSMGIMASAASASTISSVARILSVFLFVPSTLVLAVLMSRFMSTTICFTASLLTRLGGSCSRNSATKKPILAMASSSMDLALRVLAQSSCLSKLDLVSARWVLVASAAARASAQRPSSSSFTWRSRSLTRSSLACFWISLASSSATSRAALRSNSPVFCHSSCFFSSIGGRSLSSPSSSGYSSSGGSSASGNSTIHASSSGSGSSTSGSVGSLRKFSAITTSAAASTAFTSATFVSARKVVASFSS